MQPGIRLRPPRWSSTTRRGARALIGVHALGGTLAEVGAPALAGFLLASLPWQTVLQLSALPALVMGAVFLKLRAHLPRARHSHTAGTSLRALIDVWRSATCAAPYRHRFHLQRRR